MRKIQDLRQENGFIRRTLLEDQAYDEYVSNPLRDISDYCQNKGNNLSNNGQKWQENGRAHEHVEKNPW